MDLTRMKLNWNMVPAALVCAALIVSGCTPKKTVKKTGAGEGLEGSADADGKGVLGPGVDAAELAIRGKEFREVSDLQTIHFDYDKYELSDSARTTLQKNSDYLKDHPDLEILVEGHCDERGTTEYNLALGQKRAASVRDYYIRLGVPGKAIATLSFGEERPACAERTEECWLMNRRAVSKIRAQVSAAPTSEHNDTP
jgi:peptidoglycan-associated lipoprotein